MQKREKETWINQNKKNKLIEILCVFLITLLIVCFLIKFQLSYVTIEDEQIIKYSALNFNNYTDLVKYDQLNNKYTTCIFSKLSSLIDEKNYPSISSSEAIFFLPFSIILGKNFLLILNNIFVILITLLVYLITKKFTKSILSATTTSIVFILSPIFLKWSLGFFNIIPALFFFLLTTYFLFIYKKRFKYFFVGLSFLGLLMIRPGEFLFIIPIIVVGHLRNAKSKDFLLLFYLMFFLFLTILIANNEMFGGFFNFPQLYIHNLPCLQNNFTTTSYFTIPIESIDYLYSNTLFFILNFSFAFPVMWVAIFFGICLYKRKKEFIIFSLLILIVLLAIYGRYTGYGYSQENLQSSFTRHFIYLFSLLSINIGLFIKAFRTKFNNIQSETIFAISTCIIILLILNTYSYLGNGIEVYNEKKSNQHNITIDLLEKINPTDLVITDVNTNKLIPIESGIVQLQFDKAAARIDYNTTSKEFKRVLSNLVEDNQSISVLVQRQTNYTEDLITYLNNNYTLSKQGSYIKGIIELYKIRGKNL